VSSLGYGDCGMDTTLHYANGGGEDVSVLDVAFVSPANKKLGKEVVSPSSKVPESHFQSSHRLY